MEFLDYLDSGVVGTVLGMVGALGKQIVGYFERKNERSHELEVRKYDLKQTEMEAHSAEKLATIEAKTQTELASEKSFQTSMNTEGVRYYDGKSKLLEWLDFLRGFNRIVLTWLLLICCMVIYFHVGDLGMKIVITKALVMLACTAIGWWFGERPLKKLQL